MDKSAFYKKLDNFWYYYKFHLIGGIVGVILIFSLVSDILHQEVPDVSVANIGNRVMQDESADKLKKRLDSIVSDADGNGKKHIQILPIMYSEKMDPEQKVAVSQKIQLTLVGGEAQLFLVDKATFKDLATLGAFQPLEQLAAQYGIDPAEYPDIKLKARDTEEEHIYGLPLTNNELLKEMGYDSSEVYAAVKVVNNDEQKNKSKQAAYKNAFAILEELLKYNKKAG